MKAFLNTLWDTEPKPAKLIFINDGVRLTTEGSEVLETLQTLEKDGIQIVSCGTCLEYYHLKEKLRVGLVTNMYETVNSLLTGDCLATTHSWCILIHRCSLAIKPPASREV